MATTAWLGTGLLGAAFVEAALGRGDQIAVWNRTVSKTAPLAEKGARVGTDPAATVRGAERVHLVLTDDAVVDQVVAALRPGLGPDTIIVDHTTTQPALTAVRARRLNAEGVRYIHCPVFIGPAMARKAQGTIMASGPSALFEAVKAGLEQQAANVVYLGDRADLASVYKLCGNALLIGLAGTVSDVLTIAQGAGVAPLDALAPLEFLNVGAAIAGRGKSMAAGNFAPSFELTMARKDVRLMLETATGPLAVLPGMAARMDALIAAGFGAADMGVIARDAVS